MGAVGGAGGVGVGGVGAGGDGGVGDVAGVVTVRKAVPEMAPTVALIVDVPAPTPLARPVLEIAAAELLLDQTVVDVQSEMELFE